MWFAILLSLAIILAINYIVAMKFAEIAEMKGHDGSTYFWFTFLLGVVGMLMVVALPAETRSNDKKSTATKLPPPKDIFASVRTTTSADTVKRCPYCGDIVKLGRCEMCGKEVK